MKSKRVRIIAIALVSVLFVGSVSYFGYRIIISAREKNAFLSSCAEQVHRDIQSFAGGYSSAKEGQIYNPFTEQDSLVIANTVSKTIKENYAANTVNSTNIKTLEQAVDDTVHEQLAIMGILMTDEEYKTFISGIKAVVTADVYKAVAERGLTDTEDLAILKEGLEAHLSSYEKQLTNYAKTLETSVNDMDKLLTALSVDSDASTDANLQALIDDMSALRTLLTDVESGRFLTTNEQETIYQALESLGNRIENAETALTLSIDTTLKTSIDGLKQSLLEERSLTDSSLNELNSLLNSLEGKTNDAILANSNRITDVNNDLAVLSGNFNQAISSYETTQANMNHVIATMQSDIGEGSVDERLSDLCVSLSDALSAGMEETNQKVSNDLTLLQSSISQMQDELNGNSDTIATLVTDIDATVLSLRSSIESGDSANVEQLQLLLTQLNETKESLSTEDSVIVNSLNVAISDLEKAIASGDSLTGEEIKTLSQSLATTQSELNTSLENLETRQSQALNSAINELSEDTTASIDSLTQAKNTLASQLTTLSSNVGTAENNISVLQTELSTISENVDAVSNDVKSLTETTTQQEVKLSTLDTEKADLTALTDAVSALEKAIASGDSTTDSKVTELVNNINTQLASLESSNTSISQELQDAMSNLTAQISASDTKASNDLKNAVDTLNANISVLQNTDSSTTADIEALQEKISALEDALAEKVTYSNDNGINTITIH